jgi:peroxiredoxin
MFNLLGRLIYITVLAGMLQSVYAQTEPLHLVADKPPAVDFTLNDMDNKLHRLSDYRGRVVIVNFWASWCPPCRAELPSMERAYQALKQQGVVMLAINVGEDADTIFNFTADYPVSFPLLLDKEAKVINEYPVIGLPTSYIINPQGRLVYRVIGTREWTEPKLMKAILDLK